MRKEHREPSGFEAFLMGFVPMVLLGSLVVPPFGIAVGILLGPFMIWRFVRDLNDRHDPRQQKLPPDPP
jgi:ABC-type phosphate transport system permease subunit